MSGYPYELVGGNPALDFLNSVNDWHAEKPQERLGSSEDVAAFAVAAGVLRPAEARRLQQAGRSGEREVRELRALRERLARIFQATIEGSAPEI